MVSFAIAEEVSSLPLNNQLYGTTSLRDNALWFPDIPESHLQLNETYFTNSDTAISGFRPLCCEFGHSPILGLYQKSSCIRQTMRRRYWQLTAITTLETCKD